MYLFGLSNNVLLLTLNRNMEMRAQMRMKKRTQRKRYLKNISMPDYAPPHVHQNAGLNTEELEQNKNISCLTRLYACKDRSCTYMTC
jgi:hypothetical protein